MAILVTAFIIILLATIVTYTVIGIVYSSSNTYTDLLPSLTSLSVEKQIVDSGTVKSSLLSQGGSTVAQISALRATYSDMTGQPPVKFPLPFLPIPFGSIQTACIPGIPCNPVSKPPSNALKAWSSRYA